MDFLEACHYLDSLQMHKIKLGLEAMRDFLEKVGHPEKKLRFVHVAGTNGKGSVCAMLASMLERGNLRVGLFTSPHLSSIRERFRINDRFISEEAFARLVTMIQQVLGQEKITYFEFTTALALLWFVEEQVDIVVFETGLGGRLDATNVVTPLVSVITNVSMDHELWLGDNLRSIAGEKAGIIKQGIPVVTAASAVPLEVIENRCVELSAPLYRMGVEFAPVATVGRAWSWQGAGIWSAVHFMGLHCKMYGEYQKENASLAIAALLVLQKLGYACTEDTIRFGLASVYWPGRLEYVSSLTGISGKEGLRYLFDGAHNPAGVASLVTSLSQDYDYRRLVVVWGAMADKDLSATLPQIASLASHIILTRPQGARAADTATLFSFVPAEKQGICCQEENVVQALHMAENLAEENDLILVAGSLYLLGEVRPLLLGEVVDERN